MDNIIDGFSLSSQIKPINKDIIVNYSPGNEVVSYSYKVYKNNEVIVNYASDTNKEISIVMDETGEYKISLTTTNVYGETNTIDTGVYRIDKEKPVIEVKNQLLTIEKGDQLDLFTDVKVSDNVDGDITNKVTTNYEKLDFTTTGLKKLVYTVVDEAGNISNKTVNINVITGISDALIYIQIILIVILFGILYLLISFQKSMEKERRISRFSINPIKDNSISLYDNFFEYYHIFISKISRVIEKSVFIKKYSKRFEKYVHMSNHIYDNAIDFVSSKIVVGIVFLMIAFLSNTIQYQIMSVYEMLIPLLVGFFVLDLVYFSKYKVYRNKLENDLLQAIIIMNNAFKSGRSITQAIELVPHELDGPIAREFEKMNMELNLGLSIDVVFSRFAERINLEEVTYLTASLSILNKTGGNIIKVFTSIEKSLFNKKKLKLELKALIGSSKIIAYVLFLIPIFFVVLISLISPTYFLAFFSNSIGIILLIIIVIIYITYVIIVNKVMKVRM